MANKTLFVTKRGRLAPRTDMCNEAGGQAYRMSDKQALAQYAATGCLGTTFYAEAQDQLDAVLQLCQAVEPEFIARTALYARKQGFMKDMPALLCAVLAVKSPGLLAEVFDRVIDAPKMLRNFVQIVRSGVVGRKSLGSLPKRLVRQWLEAKTDEQLFTGSVGNDPSLADVVKMVHPKPATEQRAALYAYLIGREHDAAKLPELVQQYEKFMRNTNPGKVAVPNVPFQLLTSLPLVPADWRQIARTASWQMTRMNLNTFLRHGVFEDQEVTQIVAERLRSVRAIETANVFPYQLMVAYTNAESGVPAAVREALQDAMEIAIRNVPHVPGKVYVFPDVSGSMHSPVTGHRPGATTAVRCIDVAALVAAAMLRRNPQAEVIPFESDVVRVNLNPRDSVMTNAKRLASLPCGGTNCSAPLRHLNQQRARDVNLVVYVSDNESWIDTPRHGTFGGSATATMNEWNALKQRNPHARMVCIDIQPYANTQAQESDGIVNVGGFSDRVFDLLAAVARGEHGRDHWVSQIEKQRL